MTLRDLVIKLNNLQNGYDHHEQAEKKLNAEISELKSRLLSDAGARHSENIDELAKLNNEYDKSEQRLKDIPQEIEDMKHSIIQMLKHTPDIEIRVEKRDRTNSYFLVSYNGKELNLQGPFSNL